MVETDTQQTSGDTLDIKPQGETGQTATTTKAAPQKAKKPDKGGFYWGTGRRKSSIARVRIKPGKGELVINKGKKLNQYFAQQQDRQAVAAPLKAVGLEKGMDVFINVKGGGTTGQAGACMLGIARALVAYNPEYTDKLREGGYLTRDSRMVERKKPGRPKARRSFQFSKR